MRAVRFFTLLRFAAVCKPGSKGWPPEGLDIAEEDASRDGTYTLELLETPGKILPVA